MKQPNPHTHTHIHARVPAGSSHPLDTHQRNKVQLRCLNSTRVFSQKWDNRAAHIHTVHRLVHTYMCVQSSSSMEAQTQPARWTAPPPDVMSSLLFMHLFLSSAELSEPDAPPPIPFHTPHPLPVLQAIRLSNPTATPCQRRQANTVGL